MGKFRRRKSSFRKKKEQFKTETSLLRPKFAEIERFEVGILKKLVLRTTSLKVLTLQQWKENQKKIQKGRKNA
jgi:hypothetical protein